MAFSFSRLILSESDKDTSQEALDLIERTAPHADQRGTASCLGEIDGFTLWLGFRKGIPSWECSCRTDTPAIQAPCAHAIALAVAWDRSRNIPDPSLEDIAYLTKNR